MAVEENASRNGVSEQRPSIDASAEGSILPDDVDGEVAYMLGDTIEEDRFDTESALMADTGESNAAFLTETQSGDELTGVLPPEIPPSIAKDRIMARVREDSVTYFVPPPEDGTH